MTMTHSALILTAVALCAWGSPQSQPASQPAASQSAGPSAGPRPPSWLRARIARSVAQLKDPSYRVRQEARQALAKIIHTPGVDEELMGYLRATRDPHIKATLQLMLEAYGEPLVMVWRRASIIQDQRRTRMLRQDAGAPWLLVGGDGQFTYDAGSPYFTGELRRNPQPNWRQGRLDKNRLWRLREMIARSGVARLPASTRAKYPSSTVPNRSGVEVALYVRDANIRRLSVSFWHMVNLRRKERTRGGAEIELAVAIRDLIASSPSRDYSGPLALFAERISSMPRQEIQKLPDWPVAEVDIRRAVVPGAVRVNGKCLEKVRQTLARGTEYKYSKYVACRVWLVPYDREAMKLYYGSGR